jgi:hypothetical protein
MKRRILSLHNLKSNVYAKRWGEAQEMRANYGENLQKTIRSVNSPRSQPNCGLHPLIHTFPTRRISTKYCGYLKIAEVWIKVCNSQSKGLVRLQIITLDQLYKTSEAEPLLTLQKLLTLCSLLNTLPSPISVVFLHLLQRELSIFTLFAGAFLAQCLSNFI